MKYVKQHKKPQKKFLYLSENLDKICWKDAEKKKDEGFLPIDDITAIVKQHTSGKKLVKPPGGSSPLAISVICSDESKTLNLDAESPQLRETWFYALEKVLKARAYARLELV